MGFKCSWCQQWVSDSEFIGTTFRNHCPFCLWSKHVDLKESGDRKSSCQSPMEPIGLTFKHEGWDKYGEPLGASPRGEPKQGELMIIHQCTGCGKISINRIAADDKPEAILKVFENSKGLDEKTKKKLEEEGIELLSEKDEEEMKTQLFGKK